MNKSEREKLSEIANALLALAGAEAAGPTEVTEAEAEGSEDVTREDLEKSSREETEFYLRSIGMNPDDLSEATDEDLQLVALFMFDSLEAGSPKKPVGDKEQVEDLVDLYGWAFDLPEKAPWKDVAAAVKEFLATADPAEAPAAEEEGEGYEPRDDYEKEAQTRLDEEIDKGTVDWAEALTGIQEYLEIATDEEKEALDIPDDLEATEESLYALLIQVTAKMVSDTMDLYDFGDAPYYRGEQWFVDGFPIEPFEGDVSETGYEISDSASAEELGISQEDVDAAVEADEANVGANRQANRQFVVVDEKGVVEVKPKAKKTEKPAAATARRGRGRPPGKPNAAPVAKPAKRVRR